MDTKALINLIETVAKTLNTEGFEHIELKHEGTSLMLNKASLTNLAANQTPAPQEVAPQQAVSSRPVQVSNGPDQTSALLCEPLVDETLKTIDSPIVGTFYNAASPESEVYVKVGDIVKKGDVVCIIEAMKLMNEIEAECAGEIVEILVDNEGPVQYGQPLFKLK